MNKRDELKFQIELNERDVPSKNNPESPYGGGGATSLLVSPAVFSARGTCTYTTSQLLEYLNITEEQLNDLIAAKYTHIKATDGVATYQSPLSAFGIGIIAFMVYNPSDDEFSMLSIVKSDEDEWTVKSPFEGEA